MKPRAHTGIPCNNVTKIVILIKQTRAALTGSPYSLPSITNQLNL